MSDTDENTRILGCELITDDLAFRRAVNKKGMTMNHLADEFPYHTDAIRKAMGQLERERFKAEEIHVYEGQVRAMASKSYGRRDSGWIPLGLPLEVTNEFLGEPITPEETARAEAMYLKIRDYLQRAKWVHLGGEYWEGPHGGACDMLSAYLLAIKEVGEEAVRRL